jgi:hypothetical protein
MSDRPPVPGRPQRGVFQVRITRASANTIQPEYVAILLIVTLCHWVTMRYSHLTALIRGGQATPQTATATNLLQLLIRQGPNM